MNPSKSETLATRPTFIRQTTNESRIEMSRLPERMSTPLLRTPSLLPQDVYDSRPGTPNEAPSDSYFAPRESRNPAARLHLPQPLQAAGDRVRTALSGHWRDIAVGGVLTGVVSWAIWATVRIHAIDNIPYCIFDDGQPARR